MTDAHVPDRERKTYYVSVGAGLLHELGTDETKRHIESMHILH